MNSSQYSSAYPLGIALVCVCLCAFGIAGYESRPDAQAGSAAAPISLPPRVPPIAPLRQASAPPADANQTVVVQHGDSLALIFSREGLSAQSLHRLVNANPLGAQLAKIAPGEEFSFLLDEDGGLLSLSYSPTPLRTLKFSREGNRFHGEELIVEPQRKTTYKHGVIGRGQNLYTASKRAGLSAQMTMELAQMFQWDIGFNFEVRAGDSFHLLVEEQFLDGEFIGFGDILAAEFINRGESLRAARYIPPNEDANYFDPQGRSMRKAFLREPLPIVPRISSNFNPHRRHPLWNRSMPHRGIDYAVPRGTRILAAGDGVVTTAAKGRANGNYVVLRHGEQFVTKYLHMSGFARGIRAGKRVQQGDTIGYVGATGWATGPHLHYEFLVNGVHQNPRTVKLPDAEPVPAAEAERFKASTAPLLAALSAHRNKSLLAVGR